MSHYHFLDIMEYFGIGYCDNGYYAGWDGLGIESEQDCMNLCLSEVQCKYAAYFNNVTKKTCSRYNQESCNLDTSTAHEKAHKSFKKGLFLFMW